MVAAVWSNRGGQGSRSMPAGCLGQMWLCTRRLAGRYNGRREATWAWGHPTCLASSKAWCWVSRSLVPPRSPATRPRTWCPLATATACLRRVSASPASFRRAASGAADVDGNHALAACGVRGGGSGSNFERVTLREAPMPKRSHCGAGAPPPASLPTRPQLQP